MTTIEEARAYFKRVIEALDEMDFVLIIWGEQNEFTLLVVRDAENLQHYGLVFPPVMVASFNHPIDFILDFLIGLYPPPRAASVVHTSNHSVPHSDKIQ